VGCPSAQSQRITNSSSSTQLEPSRKLIISAPLCKNDFIHEQGPHHQGPHVHRLFASSVLFFYQLDRSQVSCSADAVLSTGTPLTSIPPYHPSQSVDLIAQYIQSKRVAGRPEEVIDRKVRDLEVRLRRIPGVRQPVLNRSALHLC